MSIDFIALFDVSREAVSPEWLVGEIKPNSVVFGEIVARYGAFWSPKAWTIESSNEGGEFDIIGPGGFSLHMSARRAELYHMMRFTTFSGHRESRDSLRRVCYFFSQLVGSKRAIYTHEMMPTYGESLDEIEAGLRSHIGLPATSFSELAASDFFKPHAWFIDDFSDFSDA